MGSSTSSYHHNIREPKEIAVTRLVLYGFLFTIYKERVLVFKHLFTFEYQTQKILITRTTLCMDLHYYKEGCYVSPHCMELVALDPLFL